MEVDQVYYENDYWLDYTRKDRVKIDSLTLSPRDKARIRAGHSVSAPDRGGSYTQHYHPIKYNSIRG